MVSAPRVFRKPLPSLVVASLLFAGCGDDNDTAPAEHDLPGRVVDVTTKAGLAGVTVSANPSTTTDANGFYSLEPLTESTALVTFELPGYVPQTRRLDVVRSRIPAPVLLRAKGQTQTLDADVGGTIQEGGSSLTILPGTLATVDGAPVTGIVEVTVTYVDASSPSVFSFPGTFEGALDVTGEPATLETFAFATYELSQSGVPLQLAAGSTATIEFVLPANAQDRFAEGDEIGVWEFEPESATWIQSLTNGIVDLDVTSGLKVWAADVDHLSSLSCSLAIAPKHCLRGCVTDLGAPVADAIVLAIGVDFNGVYRTVTSSSGEFCLEVKADSIVRLEVWLNGSPSRLDAFDVDVPPVEGTCDEGSCTEVALCLSARLGSCVTGSVLDASGVPIPRQRVHLSPGVSVRTDSAGNFCNRAPGGVDVYVFAPGVGSVKVTTPIDGQCSRRSCVEATVQQPAAPGT